MNWGEAEWAHKRSKPREGLTKEKCPDQFTPDVLDIHGVGNSGFDFPDLWFQVFDRAGAIDLASPEGAVTGLFGLDLDISEAKLEGHKRGIDNNEDFDETRDFYLLATVKMSAESVEWESLKAQGKIPNNMDAELDAFIYKKLSKIPCPEEYKR